MSSHLDIKKYIKNESFRAQTLYSEWTLNNFDYEIQLSNLPIDVMNTICEWLVNNCVEDFICFREFKEILAGGCGIKANIFAWQHKKKNGTDPYNYPLNDITIRLNRIDITTFRLTWIL